MERGDHHVKSSIADHELYTKNTEPISTSTRSPRLPVSSLSTDTPAAVNVECRSSEILCLIRGKKAHHIRNVRRQAYATQRNRAEQSPPSFWGILSSEDPPKPVFRCQLTCPAAMPRPSTHMAVSPTAGRMQLYLIPSAAYSAANPFVACHAPAKEFSKYSTLQPNLLAD